MSKHNDPTYKDAAAVVVGLERIVDDLNDIAVDAQNLMASIKTTAPGAAAGLNVRALPDGKQVMALEIMARQLTWLTADALRMQHGLVHAGKENQRYVC